MVCASALALLLLPAGLQQPWTPFWQYQFHIVLLGHSTVGKSSLLRHYTEGIFIEGVTQTVGVDFSVHFVEIEPGVQMKVQFWGTAG